MTEQVAIILTMPQNWIDQLYLIQQYNRWLIDHKIDNKIMIRDVYNVPMALLLDPEDAIAFRLRFKV